jgi:hypothetical protein
MPDIDALMEQDAKGEGLVLTDTPPDTPAPPADEPVADEQPEVSEEPAEEEEPAAPEEDPVPDKYKGKSLAEVVRMHQEAEAALGRQGQAVGDARGAAKTAAQELASVTRK